MYRRRAAAPNLCYRRRVIPPGLLLDLVRGLTASTPPPRGLPYLGLEHATGTGFHLLDALSARGIFRKYELVLEVGAGLGGRARWLAARSGCEVVGTTLTAGEAAAGMELGRRSAMHRQVRLLPAAAPALPFRAARFTHVWFVDSLSRVADPAAALAEAHRVVRPGGWIAVQDMFLTGRDGPRIAGWRFARPAAYHEALAAAGFVDIEVRDRTPEAAERAPRVVAARNLLHAKLRMHPALTGLAVERDALAASLAEGSLAVVQLVARRPA
jgi:SAM-dependent methyltransferase